MLRNTILPCVNNKKNNQWGVGHTQPITSGSTYPSPSLAVGAVVEECVSGDEVCRTTTTVGNCSGGGIAVLGKV